jgi:WD40 repeat protein
MARSHSLLAVAVVGLTFLLTGRAAAQQAIVAKAPAGDRVATASKTVIEVRDAATTKLVWQAKTNVAGGTTFVSAGDRRHPERGTYVTNPPKTGSDIQVLIYSSDGKRLISAGKDGDVNTFDADMGNVLWAANTLKGVTDLSFSDDGKTVTAKAPDGAQTFDVATGKRLK